jgi:hypothetical protein
VPGETAETEPTQRDQHLRFIAEHGRRKWQQASGYTRRAQVEAAVARWEHVIGDGLRSRTDKGRETGVDVAIHVLNRMLQLGCPSSVRIACPRIGRGNCALISGPCNNAARPEKASAASGS